ncbi:MAG: hypothetical protein PHI19_04040, partial [Clostridia bacterium]|nr:hypothetical protein [Clostridia bacterium]
RVLAYCGGKLLDGDHMVYIIAKYLEERNEWNGKKIIGTIMSNRGVEEAAQKHGFQFIRTRVGDKYVAEEMKKTGAELGGEASGHVIIGKYQNTGDGLLAAAMLTAAECAKDVHFYDDIVDYPQASGDIITTHEKLAEYKANEEAFAEKLEEIRAENGARLVVRPSGTEPKIRIMAEASTINKTYCAIGQARLTILRGMRK